jgi:hypothetical protein
MRTTRHPCHSKMRSHALSKPCLRATFWLRFQHGFCLIAYAEGLGNPPSCAATIEVVLDTGYEGGTAPLTPGPTPQVYGP